MRIVMICAGILFSLNCVHAQPVATSSRDEMTRMAATLPYHLSTNAVGFSRGHSGSYLDTMALSNWTYATYSKPNLFLLTNSVWSTSFWLHGVKGLSATPIGFLGGLGGQGLMTMVSPRHYLCATHMHPEAYMAAFLDTNNVIHWRKSLERVDITNDTSVGILDADLPPSVGYLPVLPTNYPAYIPAGALIQGIGMSQDMRLFGEPIVFGNPTMVLWDSHVAAPFGLGTNWNVMLRAGDSSNPALLLIKDQLVLVSHNFSIQGGPNYALQTDAINRAMHQLSTRHHARTDYQLKPISLTNWHVINH